jgi:hypothetical protein
VADPSRSFVKIGSVDLTLSDDDNPVASATGPLRDAADTWSQGTQALSTDLQFSDGGSGVALWTLTSTDEAGDHPITMSGPLCDVLHNTPGQGSNICPASTTQQGVVLNVPGLPEGQNRFRTAAADAAGNTSDQAGTSDTWSIYLDRSKPTIAASGSLSAVAGGWIDPGDVPLSVHLEARDARSGIQHDDVSIADAGGAEVTKSSSDACTPPGPVGQPCPNVYANDITLDPDTIPEGSLTISATATDHVGLLSDPVSFRVRFDRTPPVARANGDLVALGDQWTAENAAVPVSVDGRDALSGVTRLELLAVNADGRHVIGSSDVCTSAADKDPSDGSCPHLAHHEITVDAGQLPDGRNHFEARARDLAGHLSRVGEDWDTYIDHTAPPKPTRVTIATNTADQASISWNPVVDVPEGAQGVSYEYLVLSDGVPITQWTATPYPTAIVPGVPEGVNLSVLVHAIDQAHNSSTNADANNGLAIKLIAPADAADLDGGVTHFSWSAPQVAHGYDVLVDGLPRVHAVKTGSADIDLGDLGEGVHSWTIRRVTTGSETRTAVGRAVLRAAKASAPTRTFRIKGALRPFTSAPTTTGGQATLAAALRPRLYFDTNEKWRPLEVYAFLNEPGIRVCQPTLTVPYTVGPGVPGENCQPFKPKGLYNGMVPHNKNGTIYYQSQLHIPGKFSSPILGDRSICGNLGALKDCDVGNRSTIYYNVSQPSDNKLVFVDWWWMLRNNPPLLGIDHHSGDWEGMSVAYDPSRQKVAYVSMSQHAGTYRYKPGVAVLDGLHPHVYVAQDSHASYPRPCSSDCKQDKGNTPGFLKLLDKIRLPLPGLRNLHTGDRLPEHDIDGRMPWGRNTEAECYAGLNCIQAIPRKDGPAGVHTDPQVALPGAWSSWPGTWGQIIDHAPLTGPPNSPGNQGRFKRPGNTRRPGESNATQERSKKRARRRVLRQAGAPDLPPGDVGSQDGGGVANEGPTTEPADTSSAPGLVDDAGTCADYAGPMVVALACDEQALERSGPLGEQALEGSARITGTVAGLQPGDGPGIAQASATQALQPGDSITLTGTMPATASLQVAVATPKGPIEVTSSALGLQDGGQLTAQASTDVAGQLIVTTPASTVARGTPPPPAARLLSVRRSGRYVRVRLSIPKGAGVQRLGMLNAAGKLRRIVRVMRRAQPIVVVRVPDAKHRTRAVRLRSAGATTVSAVMPARRGP